MRCLTPPETLEIFAITGFVVVEGFYRVELALDQDLARRQSRLGCRPPADILHVSRFLAAVNRWLPNQRRRLLWLSHEQADYPGAMPALALIRASLGEAREVRAAPGHLFDALDYAEEDQTEVSADLARQTGVLAGMMMLILSEACDGWLLAEGCNDRIEFWEGNLFFHSADTARMEEADAMIRTYDCPTRLI